MDKTSLRHMFAGTRPQLVATLTGTISAISDGMHFGWSAPVIPILHSPASPVTISKTDDTWLEIIYLIGGIAGLPVTVFSVDRIGRKNLTIASSCTSLLSWILIALAPNVFVLYIARFIAGLASDVAFVATPMYVAEIADQKIRGLLSSMIYLMMLFGILTIYAVAPFTPFYVPSVVGGSLLVLQLITFPFMPKSPYFLLTKNRIDGARKALDKLRTSKDNTVELEEISKAVERQRKEKGRLRDLLLVKGNRKALCVMAILAWAQHFTAISVMLMNMHSILVEADSVYLAPTSTALLFSGCMLVAATFASLTVDRYGRRFLLIVSTVLTGTCLLILAIYFNLKKLKYDLQAVSWVPVACVMTYAAVFKMGLGIVPIVVCGEIFSNKVKAMGMTIADALYIVFALISIELYEKLSESYGFDVPFYLFAVCSFVMTALSVVVIPETKGKTLEEIQVLLKGEATVTRSDDEIGKVSANFGKE